ncbi:hypothetical protein BWP24_16735 [Vibrio campbellii]|nr:hypothetical protein BWP24_16735 [Vibrio campbellii]ARR47133.1 hypothetical protein CAY59_23280 [Vibrio campbellii]AUV89294.1 hypothetical protein C1N50_24610 [Vibrio campbellii]PQJ47122.1 hypothetical protein BTN99_09025 [Vibrio campbellii]
MLFFIVRSESRRTDQGLSFRARVREFLELGHKKEKGLFYCGIILNKICQLSVVTKNTGRDCNAGYLLLSL